MTLCPTTKISNHLNHPITPFLAHPVARSFGTNMKHAACRYQYDFKHRVHGTERNVVDPVQGVVKLKL